MDFQLTLIFLDMENAAGGLPVDWFVAHGAVNQKGAVFFDY